MGTVDYMAPELLTGKGATVCSDIYALGMVAYKMVTGALPFDAETPLAAAILRSKAPIPAPSSVVPGLDPVFERAILRALDAEPKRRFGSATDFVKALRGERVSMTVSIPVMTRRRWVGAVAAVLVVIAGGVGWRSWNQYRGRPLAEALAFYQQAVDDIHAGAYFASTKALERALRIAPRFALAHARLAEAWNELDVSERAGQEMLLARREDISVLPENERLQVEAIHFTITREFDDAVNRYQRMRRFADSNDGKIDLDLGRAYEKAGQPLKAIESLRLATEGQFPNPAAWLQLAVLYSHLGDPAKSAEAFQQADQLYQLTSNLEGLTEVAYERGVAANRQLRLAEAAAYLQKAMDTARLASNLHQEFRARVQLANNAFLAGDSAQAETYAREAVDIAQTDQMQLLAATGIVYLGNAYLRRRDFITAEKYYRDALALARRSGSSRLLASSLASLAALHDQLDRSDEAAKEAQEALDYYQASRFALESSQCLTLLGRARRKRGDYAGALTYFERALEAAEKSKDRPQIAVAHESIGGVYFAREEYPRALEEYRKYLDLSTDSQHIGYANLRYGEMLWRLGQYAEATAALDKADGNATKYPSLRLSVLKARVGLLLSQDRSWEAAQVAQSAIALAGRDQSSDALLNGLLGVAYTESGNRSDGIRKCEQALAAAVHSTDIVAILQSKLMLARARLEAGDANRAKDLLLQAEPLLTGYPESHWRALALLAHVDRQYLGPARETLDELKRQWGEEAYGKYLKRPDIRQLSWQLLQSDTANH